MGHSSGAILALETLAAQPKITTPVLLITGARTTDTLRARSEALEAALPHVSSEVMPRQGHGANRDSPAELAGLIATFADDVFAPPAGGAAVV